MTMPTGLRIDVVTVFPEYLDPLRQSLPGRAIDAGIFTLAVHDLRRWTHDVHRSVDDSPYGGGPGMVMLAEPWGSALESVTTDNQDARLVIPTPSGRPFTQDDARRWASERTPLVFAPARYEGIDSRVADWARDRMQVEELSIGDYVLAGGEAAVVVMIEAVARLLPGFMGHAESPQQESFDAGLLEGPVYSRPAVWRGLEVPPVLLSGDHAAIARWREEQARRRTERNRPDMLG